jgi:hypothetical protein
MAVGFEPFAALARLTGKATGEHGWPLIQGIVMRAYSWFDFDPIAMAVLFVGIGAVAALAQII